MGFAEDKHRLERDHPLWEIQIRPERGTQGIPHLGEREAQLKKSHPEQILFGFNQKNKRYPGLTEKTGAKKLGKGCIEIPLEHANEFLQLFRRFRATVKIKKVIEY